MGVGANPPAPRAIFIIGYVIVVCGVGIHQCDPENVLLIEAEFYTFHLYDSSVLIRSFRMCSHLKPNCASEIFWFTLFCDSSIHASWI